MFKLDQKVRCLLVNGAAIEGTVIASNDKYLQLMTVYNEVVFIHNPFRNLLLTKIVKENAVYPQQNNNEPQSPSIKDALNNLESVFKEESKKYHPDNALEIKKLAELRLELNKQQRRIVEDKLKDHTISGATSVKYEFPQSLKGIK